MRKVQRCNIAIHCIGLKMVFRIVLSVLFIGSNNQFRNYESQFLRIFWLEQVLSVYMQLVFSPKILINSGKFRIRSFGIGYGIWWAIFIFKLHLTNIQTKYEYASKSDFNPLCYKIGKLPNKWVWNVTYLTWWLRTWEPCLFHCSDGHLEYKKCREQYPLQLC